MPITLLAVLTTRARFILFMCFSRSKFYNNAIQVKMFDQNMGQTCGLRRISTEYSYSAKHTQLFHRRLILIRHVYEGLCQRQRSCLNLSQSLLRPVCFTSLCLLFRFHCILITALVFRLGILLTTNEVRLFLKKFKLSLMSLEFGFMWRYVVVS